MPFLSDKHDRLVNNCKRSVDRVRLRLRVTDIDGSGGIDHMYTLCLTTYTNALLLHCWQTEQVRRCLYLFAHW